MRPQRDLSLGRTWASRFGFLTTLWIVGNICGLFCEFLPVSFFYELDLVKWIAFVKEV